MAKSKSNLAPSSALVSQPLIDSAIRYLDYSLALIVWEMLHERGPYRQGARFHVTALARLSSDLRTITKTFSALTRNRLPGPAEEILLGSLQHIDKRIIPKLKLALKAKTEQVARKRIEVAAEMSRALLMGIGKARTQGGKSRKKSS